MKIHYTPQEDKALEDLLFLMASQNGYLRDSAKKAFAVFTEKEMTYIRSKMGSMIKNLPNLETEAKDIFDFATAKVVNRLGDGAGQRTRKGTIIRYFRTAVNNLITDRLERKINDNNLFDYGTEINNLPERMDDIEPVDTYYTDCISKLDTIIPALNPRQCLLLNTCLFYARHKNEEGSPCYGLTEDEYIRIVLGIPNAQIGRTPRQLKHTMIQRIQEIGRNLGVFSAFLLFLRIFTAVF
jgi:hypothetical protein